MSNIYLKKLLLRQSDVDIQNFNFLGLKALSLVQILGSSNSHSDNRIFKLLVATWKSEV